MHISSLIVTLEMDRKALLALPQSIKVLFFLSVMIRGLAFSFLSELWSHSKACKSPINASSLLLEITWQQIRYRQVRGQVLILFPHTGGRRAGGFASPSRRPQPTQQHSTAAARPPAPAQGESTNNDYNKTIFTECSTYKSSWRVTYNDLQLIGIVCETTCSSKAQHWHVWTMCSEAITQG